MNRKVIHLLEIVWLSIAVIGFFTGLYSWYDTGLQESLMFFAIMLLALMMYMFRRNLRRSQKP